MWRAHKELCVYGVEDGSIVEIGAFELKTANVPGLVSFTSTRTIVISGFSFSGDPPGGSACCTVSMRYHSAP